MIFRFSSAISSIRKGRQALISVPIGLFSEDTADRVGDAAIAHLQPVIRYAPYSPAANSKTDNVGYSRSPA